MACILCILIQPIQGHNSRDEYFLEVYSLQTCSLDQYSSDSVDWTNVPILHCINIMNRNSPAPSKSIKNIQPYSILTM